MPTNSETLNRQLYQLLSKYKPKPLDAEGKATPVPDEADIFKIEFTKDGDDYGTVFITLDEDRVLTVYFGDDVANSPSDKTPGLDYDDTWSGFLHQLSSWRMTRGLKGFNTKNKDHVNDDMARRKHMRNKDKIAEGYYPMGKKASYSDAVPSVKIVIEHSRVIEEGEQRYRNINRIFLENQLGERYLLDTKKPGIARVYARHIAEGGKVNDDRWNHIGSLCEEYQKMAGFVRATRNGQFNESAQQLVNEGLAHYQSLRESLSRLTGKRGYNAYFESWTPALMETEGEETNLNELFVQETLDPRIESVMPILSRIHKKVGESVIDKELNKLAEWADSLVEAEGESIQSNNPIGIPEEEEVTEEVDTGEYDARKSTHKGETTPEQEKEFSKKVKAYGKELEQRQKEKEVDEGLDANQKRVGQLGPTEKVKNNNIGKLVGANENFINQADQAVVSEEDEMAEGILDNIKNMFKPKDPTPVSPITADDIAKGYQTQPEFKAQVDQIAKQQGISPQELIKQLQQQAGGGVAQNASVPTQAFHEGLMDTLKKGVAGVKKFGHELKAAGKEAWDEEMPKLKQDWKHPIQTVMAKEGEHTQYDRDLNPNDYERPNTDWSTDPIEAGTDRIHQKISSMLKKLSKPEDKPLDKNKTSLGSTVLDEMDKSQTPPGRDGDPRPGPDKEAKPITKEKMVKHALDTLTKSMDKAHDKKDVKEGQEDLDAILRIIRK